MKAGKRDVSSETATLSAAARTLQIREIGAAQPASLFSGSNMKALAFVSEDA